MSFYGLFFPAYVWLCMIPGRGRSKPTQRMWIVLAVAVVLALPFYWLAFIDNRMPFVIGGVAIVVLARLFVGKPTTPILF
ncbi:MAG: hypothetical protein JO353_04910 [Phycisphaerae bacterium]|nr:hypothetical protein [Phycisphaerae bacterium]